MQSEEIEAILGLLRRAEGLKDTLRSGHTSAGRAESTAEHSWRLCLMAMLFAEDLPGIDMARLLRLCILHDLAEAVTGDIPATDQGGEAPGGKAAAERAAMRSLLVGLPAARQARLLGLWEEYEAASSPEAVLAKGFDKLETILQHSQGRDLGGIDYAFNLSYARGYTDAHPLLAAIRLVLDAATRARMRGPGQG